jgi:type IV pilus assembly protein PilO
MKKPSLPALNIDFRALADDFKHLDPKDVGAWPLAPRVATLLGLFVAIVAAGWWFVWTSQNEELEATRQDEIQLKEQYVSKKKLAVNLDLYKQQLNEIDRSFGALLKQLPNKSEVEALLVEITQAGLGRGLQFELFKPGGESKREFYAEQPFIIRVTGTYHDIGAFASDIGKLSRIVTLNDLSMTPGKSGRLTVDATTRTFRYLDENEVAAQRKASKPAKGGR